MRSGWSEFKGFVWFGNGRVPEVCTTRKETLYEGVVECREEEGEKKVELNV